MLLEIDFGSSPKLGQPHNMVGGVIRCVLREIQSLELCNAATTPFSVQTSYELEISNFTNQSISDQAQKLGQHHNMVGGVIWRVLSEIQSLELCNAPSTPFTTRTSHELEDTN